MSENLWGTLPDAGEVKTPLSILREQSAFLGEMTDYLLQAEVEVTTQSINELSATLFILAPALDNYKVGILRISHGLAMYPVIFTNLVSGNDVGAQDEQVYLNALKDTLSSDAVQKIIVSLLVNLRSS